jgi:hypothetical protein
VEPVPDIIIKLAHKYDVSVLRCFKFCDKNQGASCGTDKIFLGEFDDPDIELAAFFHELGHVKAAGMSPRKHWLTVISSEAFAWELGLDLAYENGYHWEDDSKEYQYAKKCLLSYNKERNWK